MRRRFVTLDVFTNKRFAGNPLAVVLDPDGLDTAAMQTIAREFNLSETVFVFPPADKANRAKLRIFTPARELPFAGHPTVGTAVLLGRIDGGGARNFTLEEQVGLVPCRVEVVRRGQRQRVVRHSAPAVADGRRLAGCRRDGGGARPVGRRHRASTGSCRQRWSAGNPFTFVPVRDARRGRALSPRPRALRRGLRRRRSRGGLRLLPRDRRARPCFPRAHVRAGAWACTRIPATGSAAAAFAGYLAARGGYARRRAPRGHRAGLRDGARRARSSSR